jgi:K+-sensing histidine kinase KdpD
LIPPPCGERREGVLLPPAGVVEPRDGWSEMRAPFRRGGATPAGSGLGLHLVQRIAEGHGGRLAIRPRPGGGTIVALELAAEAVS